MDESKRQNKSEGGATIRWPVTEPTWFLRGSSTSRLNRHGCNYTVRNVGNASFTTFYLEERQAFGPSIFRALTMPVTTESSNNYTSIGAYEIENIWTLMFSPLTAYSSLVLRIVIRRPRYWRMNFLSICWIGFRESLRSSPLSGAIPLDSTGAVPVSPHYRQEWDSSPYTLSPNFWQTVAPLWIRLFSWRSDQTLLMHQT